MGSLLFLFRTPVRWTLFNQGLVFPIRRNPYLYNLMISNVLDDMEDEDVSWPDDSCEIKLNINGRVFQAQFSYVERFWGPYKDNQFEMKISFPIEVQKELQGIFNVSYTYLKKDKSEWKSKKKYYYESYNKTRLPDEYNEQVIVYYAGAKQFIIDPITTENITFDSQNDNDEEIINRVDPNAHLDEIMKLTKTRRLSTIISNNLKELYDYKCQICVDDFFKKYNIDIVESHHIIPFSLSNDNDWSNQIILCPNHHRLMHIAKPVYNRKKGVFLYSNGYEEKIILNKHLVHL